jgi:hypothetical protein
VSWANQGPQPNDGQRWIHHTGYDKRHGYGTNTREWRLDTVILLERLSEKHPTDIAFRLTPPKARERAPHNRMDFEPVVIRLNKDSWEFDKESVSSGRILSRKAQKALEQL